MRRRLFQAAAIAVLIASALPAEPHADATVPDWSSIATTVVEIPQPLSQPAPITSLDDPLADAARLAQAAYDRDLAAWVAAEQQIAADARTARLTDIDTASWHRLTAETLTMIIDAADVWGADARKLARIVVCESGGDPRAHNPSGASGLTQQLAGYWPERARAAGVGGASVYDPWSNLYVAAMMLAKSDSPWAPSRRCWV